MASKIKQSSYYCGLAKRKDTLMRAFLWRHHPDLNWGVKLLQSSALPLGYGAEYLGAKELAPVGADYETRTRHLHLGKVALYRMS